MNRRKLRHQIEARLYQRILHALGAPVADQIATFYEALKLGGDVIIRLRQRPWRWSEIGGHIVHMGIGSLPTILIATAFAGMVLTQEIAWHMDRALSTLSMVPGFTGQFILRELGVAIPALLLVSKVGASTTAEIGTMRVTDQIDALKLLKIDPISYLVFPRVIAAMITGACVTLFAVTVTLICATAIAVLRYNFSLLEYVNTLRHFVTLGDLGSALVKGVLFALTIPLTACAYGFRCKGGAEGVGEATTQAVVSSTIVIIALDFILTFVFTR